MYNYTDNHYFNYILFNDSVLVEFENNDLITSIVYGQKEGIIIMLLIINVNVNDVNVIKIKKKTSLFVL